jgi:hypothetical protein
VGGKADNAIGIDSAGKFASSTKSELKSLGSLIVRDDNDDGVLCGAGE